MLLRGDQDVEKDLENIFKMPCHWAHGNQNHDKQQRNWISHILKSELPPPL